MHEYYVISTGRRSQWSIYGYVQKVKSVLHGNIRLYINMQCAFLQQSLMTLLRNVGSLKILIGEQILTESIYKGECGI